MFINAVYRMFLNRLYACTFAMTTNNNRKRRPTRCNLFLLNHGVYLAKMLLGDFETYLRWTCAFVNDVFGTTQRECDTANNQMY